MTKDTKDVVSQKGITQTSWGTGVNAGRAGFVQIPNMITWEKSSH